MQSSNEIGRLMDEHGDSLLRLCCLYLHDAHLAEDAVSETFFKAYLHWSDFRGGASEKTWLTRIAINTCNSMRRGAWFRRVRVMDRLPEQPVPFELPDDTLSSEIARLPLKLRQVVLLFYYQGLETREIAGLLGISENAVSVRLVRARAKLRTTLTGGAFDA